MRHVNCPDRPGGAQAEGGRSKPLAMNAARAACLLMFLIIAQGAPLAQSQAAPPLVGILITGTPVATEALRSNFRRGMSDHGYIEGRHYVIDEKFAEGQASRLPRLAEEIVQRRPAVILTSSTASTLAARNVTTNIPIVSALMGDAIGTGLIASRPGRAET